VVLLVQGLQPLARHMRVDLRGRDIGMAEEELHHSQVGPVIEQMRCESVTQRMR
jgi:hypothetical protein